MKKIELTVEEIEHSAIPGELLPMRPAHLDCIHRNINRLIAKKQSECSQVEWFKLSAIRPEIGHLIVCTYEGKDIPEVIQFHEQWGHSCQSAIYWTPCPTPPEFDSPCVKELKTLKENNRCLDYARAIDATIEIVKRHEKKEEE